VATPELRCRLKLEASCSKGDADSQTSLSSVPKTIYVGAKKPNEPYAVSEPAPSPVAYAQYPTVGLTFHRIENRGKPVLVSLSGTGFFSDTSVDIRWLRPDGSVLEDDRVAANDRGLVDYTLLWVPLRSLGVEGTGGPWKVVARDQTSGQSAQAQFDVVNDSLTPPSNQWPPEPYKPSAFRPAKLLGGTSGDLCGKQGAWSELSLAGFTPGSTVILTYARPDESVALQQKVRVDGEGGLALIQSYWRIDNCSSNRAQFLYSVTAAEEGGVRNADEQILLIETPDPGRK
jgi:hypothetical protein